VSHLPHQANYPALTHGLLNQRIVVSLVVIDCTVAGSITILIVSCPASQDILEKLNDVWDNGFYTNGLIYNFSVNFLVDSGSTASVIAGGY
jgi:hypothetical protein